MVICYRSPFNSLIRLAFTTRDAQPPRRQAIIRRERHPRNGRVAQLRQKSRANGLTGFVGHSRGYSSAEFSVRPGDPTREPETKSIVYPVSGYARDKYAYLAMAADRNTISQPCSAGNREGKLDAAYNPALLIRYRLRIEQRACMPNVPLTSRE
jgi:hypothetical protein